MTSLPRMPDLAISLRGIVKHYGDIVAVDGLDLDVPAGTCVGLLGPNGAGKSTTMKMLTAQVMATAGDDRGARLQAARAVEGRARRDGRRAPARQPRHDADRRAEPARLRPPLPDRPRRARHAAVDRALEIAHLTDRRKAKVDELSGGMRRRLLIARALVHKPRLLLLDEPTVGLDPQIRQELWALIDALRSEGTSILMSTHYIEEAQRLADTVTIMSHGKAVASGRPSELVMEHAGTRGARGLRPARAAGRGRVRRGRRGNPQAAHRHEHRAHGHRGPQRRPARRRAPRRRTSRTSSCC